MNACFSSAVVKVEIQYHRYETSIERQSFQNIINPGSFQSGQVLNQLRNEGLEIINSQLYGRSAVMWIWCQSPAALQHMQRLYESNQLRDVLFDTGDIQSSISENHRLNLINIDSNEFRRSVGKLL